jgi:hypothetical protein
MKIAYIAHPIGGDVEANLERIKTINRQINLEEPDVVPFAPYFLDCVSMDDNDPQERERGIKNDIELIRKGFIDELRLYGNRISPGMVIEIEKALVFRIRVRPMTDETKHEFAERWPEVLAKYQKQDLNCDGCGFFLYMAPWGHGWCYNVESSYSGKLRGNGPSCGMKTL